MHMEQEREAVAAACRRIAERGLVVGTAGNVSLRVGDQIAVTATGAQLATLTAEQVTVVDLAGNVVDGELAPTSALGLHRLVYESTGAGAVAHAHALASTAVSNTHTELPPVHYMTVALGGPVRVAPYATFGSDELASNVNEALQGRFAALMENHGSVAHGNTLDQAVDRLELVEWLAELYCRSTAVGKPRVLAEAELHDVLRAAMSRNYGTTQKAEK